MKVAIIPSEVYDPRVGKYLTEQYPYYVDKPEMKPDTFPSQDIIDRLAKEYNIRMQPTLRRE